MPRCEEFVCELSAPRRISFLLVTVAVFTSCHTRYYKHKSMHLPKRGRLIEPQTSGWPAFWPVTLNNCRRLFDSRSAVLPI